MPLYKAHSLKIHVDGGSAVIIPDIQSLGLEQNPNLMAELTAAYTTPTHVALVARKILGSMQSFALATLLDTIGVAGLCITSATNPGVTMYFQKFDDNGCPVSGSAHRSITIKGGLIYPKTLSCQHQQDASLQVEIAGIKTTGNAAVVVSDVAALPTITVASARWTLGPITIGGVALAEFDDVEIDFGNEVQTRAVESNVDDTHIEQRSTSPKATIKGIDPAYFSDAQVPLGGLVATHAADSIIFRKRTQDGDNFVAAGTAEHIQFTIGGLAANTSLRGQAQRATESSIQIVLARDSSGNQPLIVDTTASY